MATDSDHVSSPLLRQYTPAVASSTYLNTGAAGPQLEPARRLTTAAIERISRTAGLTVLTPAAHAGLVCLTISGVEPAACGGYLYGHGVIIQSIPDNGSLRLSCGFFNTSEEIDRARELILENRRSL